MNNILALDVSLQHTGWAVVKPIGCPEDLLGGGVIVTRAQPTDHNKGAGMIRRVAEIVAEIQAIIASYEPVLLVAELPYGSQHAQSAVAQGICYGILGTLRQVIGLPLALVSPYAGKEAVTGSKRGSKEQVQAAIMDVWPVVGSWEGYDHICDALAALVAARETDLYRMARQR